jgi:hypothetical protein
LQTRVMAPEDFLRSVSQYGPNGKMDRTDLRLKPISLVLRPGESVEKYEENFQKWLRSRTLSAKALENDPEEERRLRQCFAYVRANTAELIHGRRSPSKSRKRSRSPVRARPGPKRSRVEEEKKEKVDWAEQMTKQVAELQEQMNRRFQEMEREVGKLRRARKGEDGSSAAPDQEMETRGLLVADEAEVRPVDAVTNSAYSAASLPDRSAEVVKAATEILKKAALAKTDPAQKRLVKDYTRLSNQIVMNETAMEDSLEYVETLESADDDEAAQHLSQIEELQSSIDNEKQRRDTTLAAVIAQEWKEKREGFERMVRRTNQAGTRHASHEQLAAVYSNLMQIMKRWSLCKPNSRIGSVGPAALAEMIISKS